MHMQTHQDYERTHRPAYVQRTLACLRSGQTRKPGEGDVSSTKSQPNQEAICKWQLLGEGRFVLVGEVTPFISTTHQGRPHGRHDFVVVWLTFYFYF